mmetsp:Transcript_13785/g.40312  ORF Transcript_13785/g.40312 Transcript_13785/m.40312 type:complete len:216 (-) Transcript_13785:344-991(-)
MDLEEARRDGGDKEVSWEQGEWRLLPRWWWRRRRTLPFRRPSRWRRELWLLPRWWRRLLRLLPRRLAAFSSCTRRSGDRSARRLDDNKVLDRRTGDDEGEPDELREDGEDSRRPRRRGRCRSSSSAAAARSGRVGHIAAALAGAGHRVACATSTRSTRPISSIPDRATATWAACGEAKSTKAYLWSTLRTLTMKPKGWKTSCKRASVTPSTRFPT